MAGKKQQVTDERATKLALLTTFLSLFGGVALAESLTKNKKELSALDLTLLGLAVFRGGRLVAYDEVTEPLRAPFTTTHPDSSGAGEAVDPVGSGPRKVIGELVSCPTCIGTWIGAGLVYGLRFLPGPTRLLLLILAGTGLAELLDGLLETLTWRGRAERERAGSLSQSKDQE